MEDGAKHTLVLYNCKVPQTGEVAFTAANAKCSVNLKVKGELSLPDFNFPRTALCSWFSSLKIKSLSTKLFFLLIASSSYFLDAANVIVIYIQ